MISLIFSVQVSERVIKREEEEKRQIF